MNRVEEAFARLGIVVDPQLFDIALTHRSWAYENGRGPTNERLEFLGDSVLSIVVTEQLYRQFPHDSEGQLARMRAAVVSGHSLARVARRLEIGSLVKLGHGEVATHGSDKDSILADTVEAIIGAVHMSAGFEASFTLVHDWMDHLIEEARLLGAGLDWKSSLQELTSRFEKGSPSYTAVGSGPDHDRRYEAHVTIGDDIYGPGRGTSKRQAEQGAAALAYEALAALAASDLADETDEMETAQQSSPEPALSRA
ncbi:MAG: ribonuclease III [Propionibacteriaceae bacterium]|nr:ribonuclease III [Propionibacteriaceae bacterium]